MSPRAMLNQSGSVHIIVVLALLTVMGILTVFAGRMVLADMRITSNVKRYNEALNSADYAIEQGVAYLKENLTVLNDNTSAEGWVTRGLWQACGNRVTLPCGDGTTQLFAPTMLFAAAPNQVTAADQSVTFTTYFLVEPDQATGLPVDFPVVTVVATGSSDAGLATINLRRDVKGYGLFANTAPAPILSASNVAMSGSFGVWGSASGLGAGKPLSLWSNSPVDVGGSMKTYDVNNIGQGNWPNNSAVLTDKDHDGGDIIANDAAFPADMFLYTFGFGTSEASRIRDQATVVDSCDSVTQGGFYWISSAECRFTNSGGSTRGSPDAPILLIVDNVDLRFASNIVFYGMVYLRGAGQVKLVGNPEIHGALLTEGGLDLGAGNLDTIYDRAVLDKINKSFGYFSYISGTWNDEL